MNRYPKYSPIADRDWLFEKEAAQRIGIGHSTLRGWRYEDEMRRAEGLPWIGRAPRFYKAGRNIRYKIAEVEKWTERNSGPDPLSPPPK